MPEHQDPVPNNAPHTDPDDIDLKAYLLGNKPDSEMTLADQVRFAYGRHGFADIRVEANPDGSVRFCMARGRHARFATLEEAHLNLLHILRHEGLRVTAGGLEITIEGDIWSGVVRQEPSVDPDDPAAFIARHLRQNPAQGG